MAVRAESRPAFLIPFTYFFLTFGAEPISLSPIAYSEKGIKPSLKNQTS
ncbi:hypothetical protein EBME_1909 [bacterium endosymbiont of Mortierella elongata FMR23-6]|nr:hypothetical protein EBME_1909 [bacterium endosymbiont of Mortierella elongata FMR23-6]